MGKSDLCSDMDLDRCLGVGEVDQGLERILHQPILQGHAHRFGAVGHVELGQDVADVQTHRRQADAQRQPNFVVGLPLH